LLNNNGKISFREKSTKTRIETEERIAVLEAQKDVLEKNPPKQGLKQIHRNNRLQKQAGFREKSTKTRIETCLW